MNGGMQAGPKRRLSEQLDPDSSRKGRTTLMGRLLSSPLLCGEIVIQAVKLERRAEGGERERGKGEGRGIDWPNRR